MPASSARPHVVLVVPRGEAVRNFLYSDTLSVLTAGARVSVLTVSTEPELLAYLEPRVERVVPLAEHPPDRLAYYLRTFTENCHDRWLWSEVAKNNWALRDRRARRDGTVMRRRLVKLAARALAHPPVLRWLTRLEQSLAWHRRPTREFDRLLSELAPDLVFNTSHIHGLAGELPVRVASRLGMATAGFIFSWDNLTSRSRIFVPYDDYLVWHQPMKRQLLGIYPELREEHVYVTGTPQFDFHFRDEFRIPRPQLCSQLGIDPERPYVLYTAGIAHHFFDEHLHLESVLRTLRRLDLPSRPQLVVRTNIKDTSPEMAAIGERGEPDVIFASARWARRSLTPAREDLALYSSLLRECVLGINAASTVSLELLMLGKPVINLDFDPPGTDLPRDLGYQRHIRFDHYRPVAESGAVMVARSNEDMRRFLARGLSEPEADRPAARRLLERMFGDTLDGRSGERVGHKLLELATR